MRMKKNKIVWLFNHYAQEPGGPGGTRHFGLAKHMINAGWDMKIIAASVDHFTGKQRLSNAESHKTETINNVSFTWLKTPEYKGSGILRIVNMVCYSLRAYLGGWKKDIPSPDIIIGSSVHPFAAIAALLLAKKYSIPFVFEVRDLWPETLVAMGSWKENSLKTLIFRKIEKYLYIHANKIITLLPFAHEYIEALGIAPGKIIWISNGAEIYSQKILDKDKDKDKDNFTLIYFGAHGPANNLDLILEAMSILGKQQSMNHVILRLIGDGSVKESLIQISRKLNLRNVFFEDSVNKEDIPKIAIEADAFIIAVRNQPKLYRYGISMNKIFDYLAAARPILMASNARNNPIEEASAGFTSESENPEKLAISIKKLVNTPSKVRDQMGSNGKRYVEDNFSYKSLGIKMANVLDSID